MTKRMTIVALIGLTLAGSLFANLSMNMFFGYIPNMGPSAKDLTILIPIPAITITLMFAASILFVIRAYKRPNTLRRLSRTYLIIFMVLSALGLITSILVGAVVYRSFVTEYPFPGYTILFLILNALLLCGSIACLVMIKKFFKEDEEVFKVKVSHIFSTLGWFLFILLVFNRLGFLLAAPIYVYLRNLYLTFPFYLYLLVPAFLGVIKVLSILEIPSKKASVVLAVTGLSVEVVLFVYIFIVGMLNSQFISSISQAMPLERLASMPLEILIHGIALKAVGVLLLVQALKKKEN